MLYYKLLDATIELKKSPVLTCDKYRLMYFIVEQQIIVPLLYSAYAITKWKWFIKYYTLKQLIWINQLAFCSHPRLYLMQGQHILLSWHDTLITLKYYD